MFVSPVTFSSRCEYKPAGDAFHPDRKTGMNLLAQFNAQEFVNTFVALFVALVLGVCIGAERQYRQRNAGLRTNALVALGAAAFVDLGMRLNNNVGAVQVLAYIASGVGFLGAGVIFKDAGGVRGLNTAATIWCSAAIGAISGLGNPLHALLLTAAVLLTNIVLRPLAYRLYPAQAASEEHETTYGFELICRPEDENHMRALLLQAMARISLTLISLRSEDIEGTPKMRVMARIRGIGRQDESLEQIVMRLSLQPGVSSVSWAVQSEVAD